MTSPDGEPALDPPAESPEIVEEVLELPETEDGGRVVEEGAGRRLIFQEAVRASLAFTFAGILVVTIVFAFLNVNSSSWTNTKELLQLLLPAEMALLGSAVGFYFGARRQ